MFEQDLRAKIGASPAVLELLGKKARIAWGDRPQASGLPAITLDIIADRREQHMTDFQALRSTQVQADCWSDDRLIARELREAVIAAVVPALAVGDSRFGRSFVDRSASSFEKTETAIVYRERIDFSIWHCDTP